MDRLKVYDGDFTLEFPGRGKHSIVLKHGQDTVFSCGRMFCGKFSEVGALEKKLRIHPNQDNLSAEIESTNVIPFGCEYEISRDIVAASGFARLTCDVRAVNFGRVGDLTLEEIRFYNAAKVTFMVYGENSMRECVPGADHVIYSGSEPIVMATVVTSDGITVDFGCGSDLWRLRSAANMPGVDSLFALKYEDGELVLSRQPLIYGAETEIEQRPWRFKSIMAWKKDQDKDSVSGEVFDNAPCMLAPAARRDFRKKVRRSDADIVCANSVPSICDDASHLEKPEKNTLLHFDLEEYITSYIWANRQLNKKGKRFSFAFKDNPFSHTAAVQNLSKVISRLSFEL